MTGQLGAVNLNERIASIKKSLAKHPKINIVATEGTEDIWPRRSRPPSRSARWARMSLKGIFGVSQVGGPAVSKVMATKEFGSKKGTVKVFAFDDLLDTVKGLKQSDIQGTMVQRPVTMGKMSVEHLVNQINGKETAPKDLDTGFNVVTSQNLTSYTK